MEELILKILKCKDKDEEDKLWKQYAFKLLISLEKKKDTKQ